MELINNKTKTLRNDLYEEIQNETKMEVIASDFSIYVFQELKDKLKSLKEFQFIFSTPKFLIENKIAYLPYEQKFRNTLLQKAIAKECTTWISEKAQFKVNTTKKNMTGFLNVGNVNYMPINDFSMPALGCVKGNDEYTFFQKTQDKNIKEYKREFNLLWNAKKKTVDVTDNIIKFLSVLCKDNAPDFIYHLILCSVFEKAVIEESDEKVINEAVGLKDTKLWNMLYSFQKDAVCAIINKLEKYNGCILADSVGLGKTFTALAVIKYYELKNNSILVLCPKKLSSNWNTYKENYRNNPLSEDRLRYDVLYHTDLDRLHKGQSNGIDLAQIKWENYDLIVIDESHNFRNGEKSSKKDSDNRYSKLLNNVIKKGVKSKVLMLSATPVNTKFNDLKNQIALAYEGESERLDKKLGTKKSIDTIFSNAQRAFNIWSKKRIDERTTENLLQMLDLDFFELLDSVTIARSRKHIQKFYDVSEIGTFPKRLTPISIRPKLTSLQNGIDYQEIFEQLNNLSLVLYTPTHFILSDKVKKYAEIYKDNKINIGFTQANREQGLKRIMAINLMKRIESSIFSFKETLCRIEKQICDILTIINKYDRTSSLQINVKDIFDLNDYEDVDIETYKIGKSIQIDLKDMDYVLWRDYLTQDQKILANLIHKLDEVTVQYDYKLQCLFKIIDGKVKNPINSLNKKVLIFTAFSDTAQYLYENVGVYAKEVLGLETAMITGSKKDKSTLNKLDGDFNSILTHFSPVSRNANFKGENIDILIATDCISEGQNLQDCDYLINYDIHWNPVRIIQRFGRIDRIGSKNQCIQLVNFWPDLSLDEYINLKTRVETRMKIVDLTATADDNLLSENETADIEYRKTQLKRLQEEVVDIEDMSGQASIMNLGLREYKTEAFKYKKKYFLSELPPMGLYTLVKATESNPPGVIFVLKKCIQCNVADKKNILYPFYIVYVSNEKKIVCDYKSVGEMLTRIRGLCKGKLCVPEALYQQFNEETNQGWDMHFVLQLLDVAINSVIEVKEDDDIDSLFERGGTTLLEENFKDVNDFEVVSYIIVR